jgi:hypothetical protein
MAWISEMAKKRKVEESLSEVAGACVRYKPSVHISRVTVHPTRSVLEYYDKLGGLTHNIWIRN